MPEHTEKQLRLFRRQALDAARDSDCEHCNLRKQIFDAIYDVFIADSMTDQEVLQYMRELRE